MMCNCKEKVNEELAKHNTVLSENSLINMTTGSVQQSLILATERLSLNGKRTKVWTVHPSFCPFCGERYQRPQEATGDSDE